MGWVPGSAPVPRQVGHADVRSHRDRDLGALDRLLEGQADRGLEVAALLGRRPGARAARAPPPELKMFDRMSEKEPKSRPGAGIAAAAERPPPANTEPPRSYFLRFSGSPRTS